MSLETFKENQKVFEWNSIGDKFYLILQGKVGIWIKNIALIKDEFEDKQ